LAGERRRDLTVTQKPADCDVPMRDSQWLVSFIRRLKKEDAIRKD